MIRIHSRRQLTSISPSQWEARTEDDRPVYIRYRHGELSVRVGPVGGTREQALDAQPMYDEEVGERHGCCLDWHEVAAATGIEEIERP